MELSKIQKAEDMLLEQMAQVRRFADDMEHGNLYEPNLSIHDMVGDICKIAEKLALLEQLEMSFPPIELPSPFSASDEDFIKAAEATKARILSKYNQENYIPARWDSDGSDKTAR